MIYKYIIIYKDYNLHNVFNNIATYTRFGGGIIVTSLITFVGVGGTCGIVLWWASLEFGLVGGGFVFNFALTDIHIVGYFDGIRRID